MIATLQLEAIGDNYARLSKMPLDVVLRRLGRVPPAHASHLLDPKRRAWVAHVTGRSAKFGLERAFIEGLRDYKEANSVGSRGVMLTFILYPGRIYEVRALLSWSKEDRYFCHVVDGAIVRLTQERALAILDGGDLAAQSIVNLAARS